MAVLGLRGCTPEPLGNYLKGLGVFRLIAEQADPLARAWWKNGFLRLQTKLSCEDVAEFFLHGIGEEKKPIYSPTPVFAPWGGSPGFYADGDKRPKEIVAKLRKLSQNDRFSASLHAIKTTDAVLNSHEWVNVPKKKRRELKPEIIAAMRNAWGRSALDWFDACVSLEAAPRFGFLFGTGGNEGRADITINFWELIEETIGLPTPKADTQELLRAALFARPRVGGTDRTAGQHFPLAGGSANCGQDFFRSSSANPWDVILMMEGAVLFAGATTKRLSQHGKGKAAFPFMIDHLATEEPSASIRDEAKQDTRIIRCRAEFWMPLWHSPTSLQDIRALLSEGRLQRPSGEHSEHTLHAMEAIKTLGVSRGIDTFHRVALFERRGKGYYLASSLGFHPTSRSSESFAGQLAEIDNFRQQVYYNLREGPGVPDRVMRARQRFHTAIARLLERDEHGASTSGGLLDVLAGASAIEREVSLLKNRERILTPCPPVSARWLHCDNDDSGYRLARAIAGIVAWGESSSNAKPASAVEAIRANLLPVTRQGRFWAWSQTARSVVWARGAPLHISLSAVLRRRLIDAQRGVGDGLPLWSPFGAGFQDLLAFWHGEVDEQRTTDLIYGLSLVNAGESSESHPSHEPTPDLQTGAVWFDSEERARTHLKPLRWQGRDLLENQELRAAFELPRIYHLLKLCFIGGRLLRRPVEGMTVARSGDEPFPPRCLDVLTLLEAGRLSEAVQVAARRLQAKGYPALMRPSDMKTPEIDSNQCRRLAGMLLIPVRQPGTLAALAVKPATV